MSNSSKKVPNGSRLLQEKLTAWKNKIGNSPFVVQTDSGQKISYSDFYYAVSSVREFLGSEPKTVIAAIPGGVIDAVFWIATLTGGHTFIPVSPNITEYEQQELITQHNPDIILSDSPELLGNLRSQRLTSQVAETIMDNGIHDRNEFPDDPKEGYVYLSSSGSTGNPKGMILSATKVAITADNIRKSHKLTRNDRGLTPLPFYHVNAPIVSLITSLLSGGMLIIAPKFSRSQFWNWVEQYDPTWISVVPTIIAMLLSTKRPDFLDYSSLKFIRTASAPLPVAYLERFEKTFRVALIETYGISEAASTITANPVPPGMHKAGSVGLPIGVSLKICEYKKQEKKLIELPTAQVGEICVRGNNVIEKYEKGVGKSAFVDGWFRTGDLGYKDHDGYIFITGRIKEIIIRGGENIAPREIEEVLLTYPEVREAVVVGHPDPIYGEKIVAFVVLDSVASKKDIFIKSRLKQHVRAKLSSFKVPENIYILSELPKGRTGKIDKTILKQSPHVD